MCQLLLHDGCVTAQVNHWWYEKQKAAFPDGPIGGYTRVLHCNETDDIMHMVPTTQVTTLPDEYVRWYPVVNRAWAIVQWLSRMTMPEQYVLMTETDEIFVAPPPLLGTPERPSSYCFSYVDCSSDKYRPVCEDPRFNPGRVPAEKIPAVSSSPPCMHHVMVRPHAMLTTPVWIRETTLPTICNPGLHILSRNVGSHACFCSSMGGV